METDHLVSYLSATVKSKREPASVGRMVVREFLLHSLDEAGKSRAQTTDLSDENLHALWQQLPKPKAFAPLPTPYTVIPCYRAILIGITRYDGIKFVAKREAFVVLDSKGQNVYEIKGLDARDSLCFIGLADEVLRPFILCFQWERESTLLELGLADEQLGHLQTNGGE